ncbi:MAG: helix-turn-helix transcriptional regulator [Novosphingobium sp.]
MLKLMSSLPVPTHAAHRSVPARVRTALADIEALVTEPDLTPEALAARQGVSRRRLDALLASSTGATLAAHISERRLTQAAASLCDPSEAKRSITQIAHDCGFQDGPHFSRSFKKRFNVTPRDWRRRPDMRIALS